MTDSTQLEEVGDEITVTVDNIYRFTYRKDGNGALVEVRYSIEGQYDEMMMKTKRRKALSKLEAEGKMKNLRLTPQNTPLVRAGR